MNYTEIKTFEDACQKLGVKPDEIQVSLPEKIAHHTEALVAHTKLVICAEAVNDGWKPDWSNFEQRKYTPWFDMESSASGGFACDVYDGWYTGSYVGSRLSFETREKAEYFANQFRDLYEAYFVIKK